MKTRLVDAATRLFGAQGYEATSIQAVAEAVGVRKQSLLHHYPSKELLLSAVMESTVLHWRDELPKLLARASGEDRFSAMANAVLGFFRENPNRARLALRAMLDQPGEVRALLREHLSPYAKLLAESIRIGQTSGMIRTKTEPEAYLVHALMMILATVATGDVASALVGQDDEDRDNELVRMLRESLFLNPTETP